MKTGYTQQHMFLDLFDVLAHGIHPCFLVLASNKMSPSPSPSQTHCDPREPAHHTFCTCRLSDEEKPNIVHFFRSYKSIFDFIDVVITQVSNQSYREKERSN
jgi:hypothetical protein